jgi:DnaK suppressor protein
MSQNKVPKKGVAAHKDHKKPSAKKTVAAAPVKKPAPAPARAFTPAAPAPAPKRRLGASLLTGPMRGFTPYQPTRGEDYMSKGQLEHFRQILLAWKRELMEEVDRTMLHMKDDAANFPDPNDRATQESEFGLELRTRDRERKLLKKIDSALSRIDDGSYGYCEETGDEIGLRRLEARPVATLCVEAQERRELAERQFRDREDQYR